MSATTTYCDQCGSQLDGIGAYCSHCGSSVATEPTRSAPTHDEPRRDVSGRQPHVNAGSSATAMRGIVTTSGRTSARSKAWIYYAVLAVLCLFGVFAGKPIGLVGSLVCAAYSYYIYQGGRVVIWFW